MPSQNNLPPAQRGDGHSGHAGSRPLVLVVDDERELRDCLEMVLQDEGYDVLEAPHGAAAIELFQDHQPDAIILDLQMPVMDGRAFARAYHELPGPHAPIILLTASAIGPALGAELGVAAAVAKPFDVDALLLHVGRCVDRSASASRNVPGTDPNSPDGRARGQAPAA